jgi:hypothetical protein
MIDSTDDFDYSVCARCDLSGIHETWETCPDCKFDLGEINSYSRPISSTMIPPPVNRYSFIIFECQYSIKNKIPFRFHGDCPSLVTSIVTPETADQEGVILDSSGSMSEWLSAFGLYPAVGDVIAAINGRDVAHLNSNQIKRILRRLKRGTSHLVNALDVLYYSVRFRRHYLEVRHNISQLALTIIFPLF